MYGAPRREDRLGVWDELRKFNNGSDTPWCCIGDFNELRSNFEKKGGRIRPLCSFLDFESFISDSDFIDLEFKGPMFTWSNNQMDGSHIMERIDRALCNPAWREMFERAQLIHLEPLGSDHSPLILMTRCVEKKSKRSFKFELMWLDHEGLKDVIESHWLPWNVEVDDISSCFLNNLSRVKNALIKWSKKEFPNNRKTINDLLAKFQDCFTGTWNEKRAKKARSLANEIDVIWDREEKYWAQRSRVKWLACGDKNSKFFHMTTIQRRQRNKVVKLKRDDGQWTEDSSDIANSFSLFYSNLFSTKGPRDYSEVLDYVQQIVDVNDNALLAAPVGMEEVKAAVFDLGALKAPGPDGYSGLFYHHAWNTVGSQVCKLVQDFFTDGRGLIS